MDSLFVNGKPSSHRLGFVRSAWEADFDIYLWVQPTMNPFKKGMTMNKLRSLGKFEVLEYMEEKSMPIDEMREFLLLHNALVATSSDSVRNYLGKLAFECFDVTELRMKYDYLTRKK